jgi:hypothetical protein
MSGLPSVTLRGSLVVYLSDPDGYTIELFQPPVRRVEADSPNFRPS